MTEIRIYLCTAYLDWNYITSPKTLFLCTHLLSDKIFPINRIELDYELQTAKIGRYQKILSPFTQHVSLPGIFEMFLNNCKRGELDVVIKKLCVSIITVLFIGGCSDSDGPGDVNKVTIPGQYIGKWHYVYPTSQCTEEFIFNSGGTFTESSLDERQTGTFRATAPSSSVRGELIVDILTDNNLTNCDGVVSDDSGTTFVVYVEFPSDSQMEWYIQSGGGAALGTFNKQGS